MTRSNVVRLAAQVGRNAQRQDAEDGLRAEHEHAVGSGADDAPKVESIDITLLNRARIPGPDDLYAPIRARQKAVDWSALHIKGDRRSAVEIALAPLALRLRRNG